MTEINNALHNDTLNELPEELTELLLEYTHTEFDIAEEEERYYALSLRSGDDTLLTLALQDAHNRINTLNNYMAALADSIAQAAGIAVGNVTMLVDEFLGEQAV